MRCEDLKIDLALYLDGALSKDDLSLLEAHLTACPLCRVSLSSMQEIRNGLHALPRPKIPQSALNAVRLSVRARTDPGNIAFGLLKTGFEGQSYRVWLLSYTVGACASVVLGFSFLWLILAGGVGGGYGDLAGRGRPSSGSSVLLANNTPNFNNGAFLSPKDFANTRSDIAAVSPSVNPQGSLIELTKSLVSSEMKDDEVVVVADVFQNGSAQIAQVVEPSRNQNAVDELARALDYETVNSPFVPANFDQRSDTIRVVLKIQSVYVSTRERSKKLRSL
jgi:hypothetical protein